MTSEISSVYNFDSELEWYHRTSLQDKRCIKAVDYSLVVNVTMDGLPICFRSRNVRGCEEITVAASLGHVMRCIASLCIKMSTPNCSTGLPHPARLTISVLLGSKHSNDVMLFLPTLRSSDQTALLFQAICQSLICPQR
jgi:hypothetical protein